MRKESQNSFEFRLKLICCSYAKLANSIQSDQVEVRTGDMIQGGEMLEGEDGHEIAFEYIANIQRLFDRNGQVFGMGIWQGIASIL